MSAAVAIVVLLAIAGLIGFAISTYYDRQRERLRSIAEAAGLRVEARTRRAPKSGFAALNRGSSRKISGQMWRPGEQDTVYQLRYTEGSGDSSRTVRRTVAIVNVPFNAPHMTISTENWWSRLKRSVGLRDIEVESPAFNDRYQVRCDDERFAIALLDPPMIGFLLSPQSGRGSIDFEFLGDWMLCHCDQLAPEELPSMLFWAQSVRHQLPTVLSDLYRL